MANAGSSARARSSSSRTWSTVAGTTSLRRWLGGAASTVEASEPLAQAEHGLAGSQGVALGGQGPVALHRAGHAGGMGVPHAPLVLLPPPDPAPLDAIGGDDADRQRRQRDLDAHGRGGEGGAVALDARGFGERAHDHAALALGEVAVGAVADAQHVVRHDLHQQRAGAGGRGVAGRLAVPAGPAGGRAGGGSQEQVAGSPLLELGGPDEPAQDGP